MTGTKASLKIITSMKSATNSLKQIGSVFAWRYLENTRNFPGWHLAFDPPGLHSLEGLFRRMVGSETGTLRSVWLTPPTSMVLEIANNRRAAVIAAECMRVVKVEPSLAWSIATSETEVAISAGADQMSAFADWLCADRKSFDTTFGQNPPIWYWGTVAPMVEAPPNKVLNATIGRGRPAARALTPDRSTLKEKQK
jgi:hypothetical protein